MKSKIFIQEPLKLLRERFPTNISTSSQSLDPYPGTNKKTRPNAQPLEISLSKSIQCEESFISHKE